MVIKPTSTPQHPIMIVGYCGQAQELTESTYFGERRWTPKELVPFL